VKDPNELYLSYEVKALKPKSNLELFVAGLVSAMVAGFFYWIVSTQCEEAFWRGFFWYPVASSLFCAALYSLRLFFRALAP